MKFKIVMHKHENVLLNGIQIYITICSLFNIYFWIMAELIFSKEFFAYFYFGIYSKPDYEYVSSLVEYFNEKWKLLSIKSFPNHQTLSIFKNIIDYLNIVKYKLEDDEYIEKL